jgi:Mor family transcriptional regulator
LTVETETTPLQQDLQDALRHSLAEQGQDAPSINAEQLRALSSTMARLLARRIGGRYVAFVEDRARRNAAVLSAWNGRNREEVMKRFGISRRLFYSIISSADPRP